MKLSSVVKALGSLCLLLADGSPVLGKAPQIIGPHNTHVKAKPGEVLLLHCDACTDSEDITLIYWLVNGLFPEEANSDGRITELEESTLEDGKILQRSLLLKNVTSGDLRSNFTCVVTNSIGMGQKTITLSATKSDCRTRRKRRN
ncbi:interleukin-18 receptor 1-like isoform X2 [Scomber scombrus]|uniref:Interleukin-18 receptor 1-like isoform X2 n=1 Tax=Scomber scombrus TaxID=13677 RepID=A0AAV1N4X2_SCOSC